MTILDLVRRAGAPQAKLPFEAEEFKKTLGQSARSSAPAAASAGTGAPKDAQNPLASQGAGASAQSKPSTATLTQTVVIPLPGNKSALEAKVFKEATGARSLQTRSGPVPVPDNVRTAEEVENWAVKGHQSGQFLFPFRREPTPAMPVAAKASPLPEPAQAPRPHGLSDVMRDFAQGFVNGFVLNAVKQELKQWQDIKKDPALLFSPVKEWREVMAQTKKGLETWKGILNSPDPRKAYVDALKEQPVVKAGKKAVEEVRRDPTVLAEPVGEVVGMGLQGFVAHKVAGGLMREPVPPTSALTNTAATGRTFVEGAPPGLTAVQWRQQAVEKLRSAVTNAKGTAEGRAAVNEAYQESIRSFYVDGHLAREAMGTPEFHDWMALQSRLQGIISGEADAISSTSAQSVTRPPVTPDTSPGALTPSLQPKLAAAPTEASPAALPAQGIEAAAAAANAANQARVVSIKVKVNKDGEVSVGDMKPEELRMANDVMRQLPSSQLVASAGTPESQIMRALLMQEIHDTQLAQGAQLGTGRAAAQRLKSLRESVAALSQLPASKPVAPAPSLIVPDGGVIKLLSNEIIQQPTNTQSGVLRLAGGSQDWSTSGSGWLLLPPQGVPFWKPNEVSSFKPGDPMLWTVKGAPNTAALMVPDIHGHNHLMDHLLKTGLEELARRPEKHKYVVFTGDYINKGPESYAVVETVRRLSDELGIPVVTLRGNHEGSYTESIFAPASEQPVNRAYMALLQDMLGTKGFDRTAKSYQLERPDVPVPPMLRDLSNPPDIKKLMKDDPTGFENTPEFARIKQWYETFQQYWLSIVPPEHTQFFKELKYIHKEPGSDYTFMHSSGNPRGSTVVDLPNPWKQSKYDAMWGRPYDYNPVEFAKGPMGDSFFLGGHSMVQKPFLLPEGIGDLDWGTFPMARMAGALITPDMLHLIFAPYGEPASVHSVVEAAKLGLIDTQLQEGNRISNIRINKTN